MATTVDRLAPLCDILLGAAYADSQLSESEQDEVRALLEDLAGDLPVEIEQRIATFNPKTFDLKKTCAVFAADPLEDKKKLLFLVSAIIEADEEHDLSEDEYLHALATALSLPESALEGLTVEIETEELKETFAKARKGPPPPPQKLASVDVDMD